MGGKYVDREIYGFNTDRSPLPLLLEPWGLGGQVVHGCTRPLAHLYLCRYFGSYTGPITNQIEANLTAEPIPGTSVCPPVAQA